MVTRSTRTTVDLNNCFKQNKLHVSLYTSTPIFKLPSKRSTTDSNKIFLTFNNHIQFESKKSPFGPLSGMGVSLDKIYLPKKSNITHKSIIERKTNWHQPKSVKRGQK